MKMLDKNIVLKIKLYIIKPCEDYTRYIIIVRWERNVITYNSKFDDIYFIINDV